MNGLSATHGQTLQLQFYFHQEMLVVVHNLTVYEIQLTEIPYMFQSSDLRQVLTKMGILILSLKAYTETLVGLRDIHTTKFVNVRV